MGPYVVMAGDVIRFIHSGTRRVGTVTEVRKTRAGEARIRVSYRTIKHGYERSSWIHADQVIERVPRRLHVVWTTERGDAR